MMQKHCIPKGVPAPDSQIGATLEALSSTIAVRREAGEKSYTYRLLNGPSDRLLKKVMEEAGEVALAAKDADGLIGAVETHGAMTAVPSDALDALAAKREAALDHLRYEAADVVYHLLVVLQRYGISMDEFAAELNARMTPEERPRGAALIADEHINRG